MVQAQDTQIVEEANSIFEHYRDAVEAMSKIIADNVSQILAHIGRNIGMQWSSNDITWNNHKVNEIFNSINNLPNQGLSRTELGEQAAAMDEQVLENQGRQYWVKYGNGRI